MQNPHPLLVHFPIAFLVASALATLLGLVVRRPGLAAFARACLFVGTAAAAITVVTGFLAEQSVAPVAAAREAIEEHRLFGYAVLVVAGLLTALAVIAPRHAARAGTLRGAQAVGSLVLLNVLWLAAHEGGELVHEYGVGTEMTGPGGPLHEGTTAPAPAAPAGAPAPSGRDFR